jgi:hypothetical protein
MSPADIAALEARILEAFAAVPRPGDAALVSGDESYDPEYRAVARALVGKDWQTLSLACIREHQDALPLLTPAAFRYFLPAYLLACIRDEANLDTAPSNVAMSLAPPGAEDAASAAAFATLAAGFTSAQALAISSYLELAAERERAAWARPREVSPAGRALNYWRGRAQAARSRSAASSK